MTELEIEFVGVPEPEWMKKGAFWDVEDVLMQALKSSPLPTRKDTQLSEEAGAHTGADFVAAMQASPYKEINLEPCAIAFRCAMSRSDGTPLRSSLVIEATMIKRAYPSAILGKPRSTSGKRP
jgi:hypothetical protein